MRKFIVLNQADMMALCLNKPVDICIDKNPGVLCTEEYYLKNVINQQDEVITKKGVMTRAEAQRYYEGVLDGFKESEKCFREESKELEQQTGHCIDCKWWRDSDGVYRRGVEAESKCPMNRREVLEGTGYCYMFEPQESLYLEGTDEANKYYNAQDESEDKE